MKINERVSSRSHRRCIRLALEREPGICPPLLRPSVLDDVADSRLWIWSEMERGDLLTPVPELGTARMVQRIQAD